MLYHPFFDFNNFLTQYINTFSKFYKILGHLQLKWIDPEEISFIFDPCRFYEPIAKIMLNALYNPEPLFKTQQDFIKEFNKLIQYSLNKTSGKTVEPICAPDPKDRRFQYKDWQENLFFDFIKQYYLISSKHIERFFKHAPNIDTESKEKAILVIKQFLNLMSPSNFLNTNPEIVASIFKDSGKKLIQGMTNLLNDLDKNHSLFDIYKARNYMFKIGKNVANTKGEVIYKNDLIELIYYTPSTLTTHKTPLLIVPPWINKFYILDLSPKQSMVKWLIDNGIPVFMISWVNPGKKLKDKSFDDYLMQGPIAAINFLEKELKIKQINILGYCIGGLLSFILMAYLKYHKQEHKINSATLMTTLLDYSDAGEISTFLNEEQIEKIEQVMSEKEFFDGRLMGMAFSLLRSNDMIWSVIINNYLLGKKPLPFEVLYWNADSTRLTPKLHSYYLRNMYLKNNLMKPNKLKIANTPIDIFSVTTPCYFISSIEDHIAPWRGTYKASNKISSSKFVLTGSGHVFGMINPPYKNKYHYWTNKDKNLSPSSWFTSATKHQGSWWNDWIKFLQKHSGPKTQNIDSKKNPKTISI